MDQSEVKYLPKVDHTPAELDRVGKVLLRAAAILDEGGHCKGRAHSGSAHCLSGAVSCASFDFGHWGLWHGHDETMRRVMSVLEDPIAWNDSAERTGAEVAAKLRAIALGL